jgi:hypothetical protein
LLCLAITIARGAEPLADGLYLFAQGAPVAASQILEKEIQSQGNGNTEFVLSLTVPYDKQITPGSHVLHVAGTTYRMTSSGSSGQRTSSMHFPISGEDRVSEVAKFFGIPVTRFRHPGHRLYVEFVPAKKSFAIGEQVTATLRIVNVGTDPVAFTKGGRNRATRDNQYLFSAYRSGMPVPDIGSSANSGGLSISVALQPGGIFEDRVTLNQWFDFREPGHYDIHGSYRLDFVEPGSRSYAHFWTDFATAEFMITIE